MSEVEVSLGVKKVGWRVVEELSVSLLQGRRKREGRPRPLPDRPKTPQDPPKRRQEGRKSLQDPPKRLPERPKTAQNPSE